MRNIWGWFVGVVLLTGLLISVFKVFDDGNAPRSAKRAQTPPAEAAKPADAQPTAPKAPTPEASFADMKVGADEYILGKADAPVTIVEYASLTCSHCARFHAETLPELKKTFIETGMARLVYRDFPLDQAALMASMVARCAGPGRFFGFIDVFYANQQDWSRDHNPAEAIGGIARLGGLSPDKVNACIKDKKLADKILAQRLEGDKTFGVNSTPALFINGERYSGGLTLGQITAVMGRLIPGK